MDVEDKDTMKSIDPDSYFARLQRGDAAPPSIATTLGGHIRNVDLDAGTLESDYVGAREFPQPRRPGARRHALPRCSTT